MGERDHWQRVYEERAPEAVSWYRQHLERSLAFVRSAALAPDARIVDVGGGASTLVDDLLAAGYVNLAVIDLADAALATAQARLGGRASAVDWIAGDITAVPLPAASIDLWHDRAVFHFLTGEDDRGAYVAQVERAVKPCGYVLIATFAPDGPERCSGLPVARYDAEGIREALGDDFEKVGEAREEHETPQGRQQPFVYCFCRRRSPRSGSSA